MASRYQRCVLVAAAILAACSVRPTTAGVTAQGIGEPATTAIIERENIDVAPDGAGLPSGSGSAEHGRIVFATSCSQCHGTSIVLNPERWAYATTVFDYVHRAMPPTTRQKLSADDTYAVVAYLLFSNSFISEHAIMSASSLPSVHLPFVHKFVPMR